MTAGASPAFVLLRRPRDQPAPTDQECRAALEEDRRRLRQADGGAPTEVLITGPHRITVDGEDIDEYVIWER